jgi:hypothetical protein
LNGPLATGKPAWLWPDKKRDPRQSGILDAPLPAFIGPPISNLQNFMRVGTGFRRSYYFSLPDEDGWQRVDLSQAPMWVERLPRKYRLLCAR